MRCDRARVCDAKRIRQCAFANAIPTSTHARERRSLARASDIRDSQPDAPRAPSSPRHRHPHTERASHDAATRA